MIKVIIYTPAELAQSSYVHTGLFELEKEKYLKCKVKLRLKKDLGTLKIEKNKIFYSMSPQPKTSFYDIIYNKSRTIKIAMDLYDDPSKFSIPALEDCKFIFKRNYQKKYIKNIPTKYRAKILPLGLITACTTKHRHHMLKIYFGNFIYLCMVNIKLDRLLFFRFSTILNNFKNNYLFDRNNRDIELLRSFNYSEKEHVLFQTRCFDDETKDTKNLHFIRNNIISELKKNLKEQFKGGFLKTKVSERDYQSNISKIKKNNYYNEIESSQVAVYSNGLLTSPSWKMVEYLCKGKVILAEKLYTELPFKLESNRHVVYFENPQDCGKKSKKILNNQNKIRFLSENARKYFEKYVDPPRNLKRIIQLVLDSEKKT